LTWSFLQVVNLPFLPDSNIVASKPLVKRSGAKAPFLADDTGGYDAFFGHFSQGVGAFEAQVGGGFDEGEGGHVALTPTLSHSGEGDLS
jgi:hypothetical protein